MCGKNVRGENIIALWCSNNDEVILRAALLSGSPFFQLEFRHCSRHLHLVSLGEREKREKWRLVESSTKQCCKVYVVYPSNMASLDRVSFGKKRPDGLS